MAPAHGPLGEAERLLSLRTHGILDTATDPYLDKLVRHAASRLGTPIAAVNFVDAERQWTKSNVGFDKAEIRRDLAFCAHTILTPDELMVVQDATLDPRFAGNPLVTDAPGIRFYAGAPITDAQGRALGTLCVLDTQPRVLDEAAANALRELAQGASSRLEFYRVAATLRESQEHHRNIAELGPQIPWRASPDGEMLELSPRHLSLLSMTSEEARGSGWIGAAHPDDRHGIHVAWSAAVRTGDPLDFECRLHLLGIGYRWFRMRAAAQRDAQGEISQWYGTTEDVQDRKLAELVLRESEARLGIALEVGRLGAWELDPATGRFTASDGCARNFGREHAGDLPSFEIVLGTIHPDDREQQCSAVEHALATRRNLESECRTVWLDGTTHWVRLSGQASYGEDGRPTRMVGLSLDVTEQRSAEQERQRAEARSAYLAMHDPLTGLANRVLFRNRLAEAVEGMAPNTRAAVFFLDLDQFKAVNDTLGHEAGDTVLRLAAARLQSCIRQNDTAARFGGDEFAVLQTGVSSADDATTLARRIQGAFRKPFDLNGRLVTLGVSIGIALAPDDATEPAQLLHNADVALYRAKAVGRGGHCFYEAAMASDLRARQALKLGLGSALERGDLRLVYQPLIDLASGRISAFEALLRWQHPLRGAVSPAEFIPIAEETGAILPIGRWVLQEACREATHWPEEIGLAVNLSAVQFSGDLETTIAEALAVAGLDARRLELEVTESVLLHDSEAHLALLRALKQLGVRLAMDDFGTGYSSLGYLRQFRFDKIKIDKSLVVGLPDGSGGDAIVRAIIGLGHNLGIAITAEGVETPEQLALVRQHGCEEAQGYLFSRPIPAAEIPALLAHTWAA